MKEIHEWHYVHVCMKTGSIDKKTGNFVEKRIITNGYVCKGLAIHRASTNKRNWSVTHFQSGVAVWRNIRTTLGVLKRLCEWYLLPAGDWTRSEDEVATDEHLRDTVIEVGNLAKDSGLWQ